MGQLLASGSLQPKLRIGTPNDRHEREADRVAGSMPRAPEHTIQRATRATASNASPAADAAIGRLGAGRALDAGLRSYFEPRLGHSLGDVRVHTGEHAARAAASVDARAFTLRQHVVFGDGEYAPQTHHGQRLLAHELVHVIQQRGSDPVVQRELVYGAGYRRRFGSDAAEVRCYESRPRCEWFPASIDFEATATKSGGGTGSATFAALLDHIQAAPVRSITELGLIGHANTTAFGLGGRITADDVWFSDEGLIDADSLARESARIVGLRDRFAPDAKIVLYGCNAGAGQALLDAISSAFHVCVKGFSNEITTCIRWHLNRTRDIFDRGSTWVEDPLALERPEDIGCAHFHVNVRDNTPDRTSCVGVPVVAPPAPSAGTSGAVNPRRFGLEARVGGAFSDDGWRFAIDLGARYSLRSDRAIIWNPMIGAHLIYLPTSGDRVSHIAAAVADFGLRIQQPLEGFYADVRAGAYVGLEVPGAKAEPTESTRAIGGFTPAVGLGYHSERLSIGAEGRGFIGAGPNQFLVVGVGAWHW